MIGGSKRIEVQECEGRIIVSARANPRDLADQDLPVLADEITATLRNLPKGKPVILTGDWPLWAIARAVRLVHPTAPWIGLYDARDHYTIVVAGGQYENQFVPLGKVVEGQYQGAGPCTIDFASTDQWGIYRLTVIHPTRGRPINGHTTVDLQSVVDAVNKLSPPQELQGIVITGYAWSVVVAMIANAPALRSVKWLAVYEPRRGGAVTSWAELERGTSQHPGVVVKGSWDMEKVDGGIQIPRSDQSQTELSRIETSRVKDLEELIRGSYKIIYDYENTIQTSTRSEEETRAKQMIEKQWELIHEYLQEYSQLRQGGWPRDIQEIAARFS